MLQPALSRGSRLESRLRAKLPASQDLLRLAIFGGTFDPVHNAHLAVAREAASRFQLDRVWFVPSRKPPHKGGAAHAPFEDRFRMLELACRDNPVFAPSRLEEETGSSYSIDAIEQVRARLAPEDTLFFLIGADAFAEIETWRRWQDVVRSVDFIVVSRPGHRHRIPPGARVERLETVELPVSSSEIRRKLGNGQDDIEVPPAVLEYIRMRGLYRDKPAYKS